MSRCAPASTSHEQPLADRRPATRSPRPRVWWPKVRCADADLGSSTTLIAISAGDRRQSDYRVFKGRGNARRRRDALRCLPKGFRASFGHRRGGDAYGHRRIPGRVASRSAPSTPRREAGGAAAVRDRALSPAVQAFWRPTCGRDGPQAGVAAAGAPSARRGLFFFFCAGLRRVAAARCAWPSRGADGLRPPRRACPPAAPIRDSSAAPPSR
jgi:hypothetical protein